MNKIKLTLANIAAQDNRGPVFMNALEKLRRQPLGKDAYAVGKSIRTIEGEYALYQETYAAIVKRYGVEKTPGNWEVERGGAYEKANHELAALGAQEFEIYLDHKIKLPDTAAVADQLSALSTQLMIAGAKAAPEDILKTAQLLAGLVREWWALVLTPEDALALEPLLTDQ